VAKGQRRKKRRPKGPSGVLIASLILGGVTILTALWLGLYFLTRPADSPSTQSKELAEQNRSPRAGNAPAPPAQARAAPQEAVPPKAAQAQKDPVPANPDKAAPAPASPPKAQQAAPPSGDWTAKIDPAPKGKESVAISETLQVALSGFNPLFASGDGPYVLDLPRTVYDLRTGKAVGTMAAPVTNSSFHVRLSPDGQHLACLGTAKRNQPVPVEVWTLGGSKPAHILQTSGYQGVYWLDFASAEELVTVSAAGNQWRLQIWNVATGKVVRSLDLPRRLSVRGGGMSAMDTAAFSPGGHYLAYTDGFQFVMLSLVDCRIAGSLEGWDGGCQGLRFSDDGTELLGVFSTRARGSATAVRVVGWRVADGALSFKTEVANAHVHGPPLSGPDPETVILHGRLENGSVLPYGEVFDRKTGVSLLELPFSPIRWLGKKRLLGFKWPVRDQFPGVRPQSEAKQAVFTAAFDETAYKAKAQLARAAIAPRPEAMPGDRTAVRSLRADPARWAVTVDGPKAAAKWAGVEVGSGELVLTGSQSCVLFKQEHSWPRKRNALMWSRYDLGAGKQLGKAIELWPWVNDDHNQPWEEGSSVGAALSADGRHFAARELGSRDRVYVWDGAGSRELSLLPYGEGKRVEWLAWTAQGLLLTLGNGKLTAWEVPAGKAVYEVEGDYKGLAAFSPGHASLVVPTERHLDVLDCVTGECLGRLEGGDPSFGQWASLAFSADGKRLAGIRRYERQNELRRSAHTWDLESGKAGPVLPLGPGPGRPVHWCGSRRLLVGGQDLVDLEVGITVVRFDGALGAVDGSPDGRVWYHSGGRLIASTIPPRGADKDIPGLAGDWDVVFHPGTAVTVEAHCGDADRDALAFVSMTEMLRQAKFAPGSGDWKVEVTGKQIDTNEKLVGAGDFVVALPAVEGQVRLVAPDGTIVKEAKVSMLFKSFKSKYLKARGNAGPFAGRIELYDFGLVPPKFAMVREVWEHWLKEIEQFRVPYALAKVKGKYEVLPVSRPLQLDPPGS
jgi:WD40 repeat protein